MTPTTLFHLTPPATTAPAAPATDPTVRLSLTPAPNHQAMVDGTWWPHSRDASAELPALIAAVDQRLGRTTLCVELYRDMWEHVPGLILARGRQIRVGRFRRSDPRVITLYAGSGKPVVLLVVPPGDMDDPGPASFPRTVADVTTVEAAVPAQRTPDSRPAAPATVDAVPPGETEVFDPPTFVRLSGDIDIFTSHALRELLLDTLRHSTGILVLDLSQVSSCDAGGLAVMVGIQRRARVAGITLALASPRPYLSRLLHTTGLDRHLPLWA